MIRAGLLGKVGGARQGDVLAQLLLDLAERIGGRQRA